MTTTLNMRNSNKMPPKPTYRLEKIVPGSLADTELRSLSAPVEGYDMTMGLKLNCLPRTRPTLYRMMITAALKNEVQRPLPYLMGSDYEAEKIKGIIDERTFMELRDLTEEMWVTPGQEGIYGALRSLYHGKTLCENRGFEYIEGLESRFLKELADAGMILEQFKQRKPVNV